MSKTEATVSSPKSGIFSCTTLSAKARAGRMVLQDGIAVPIMTSGYMCLLCDPLTNNVELAWFALDGSEQHRVLLPPEKVKVSWVEKCRPSRVMVFDLHDGKQFFFFWMQSRSSELDESVMMRVQQVLDRGRHRPVAMQRSREIELPTMHKLLREVCAEAVAEDVEISDVLSSCKLLEALREDPVFYASRLRGLLPSTGTSGVAPMGILELVQDSQVQWTASILSTMLRHEVTHSYLSSAFLDAPVPWGIGVASFLARVIHVFARDECQPTEKRKE